MIIKIIQFILNLFKKYKNDIIYVDFIKKEKVKDQPEQYVTNYKDLEKEKNITQKEEGMQNSIPNLVTKQEILMGRDKQHPLSKEQEENLDKLHKALNLFRQAYGKPLIVSSGYRPAAINAGIGGAQNSAHMHCMAVDFRDTDGSIARYCLSNLKLLQDLGLWLEDPRWTRVKDANGKIISGWCHLQIRPTRKRVFIPSSTQPMVDPSFWDGKYDSSFDK